MSAYKYKAKIKGEEEDKVFGTNPNKVSSSMANIMKSLKKSTDMVEEEINNLLWSLDTQNRILKKSVKELTLNYLESAKEADRIDENEDD